MAKQIKRGTYQVTFKDGVKIICGNNYKWWYTHASEYASRKYGRWSTGGTMDKEQLADHVERVEYCDIAFVDDGGLKYASPEAYQEIIDEMTAKDGEYRTPYALLKDEFTSNTADRLKLSKEIRSL
jgi:hypothetical protein